MRPLLDKATVIKGCIGVSRDAGPEICLSHAVEDMVKLKGRFLSYSNRSANWHAGSFFGYMCVEIIKSVWY